MTTPIWSFSRASAAVLTLVVLAGCVDRSPVEPRAVALRPSFAVATQGGGGGNDRVVVALRGAEANDFETSVRSLGGTVERRLPEINLVTLRGLSAAAASAIAARADVAKVTQDMRMQWIPSPATTVHKLAGSAPVQPAAQGTDQSGAFFFPLYQWNMKVTNADDAWHSTTGGRGSLVCILDTGIDPNHVDLAGKVDLGKSRSFVASEPSILDFAFHGTFVAAIVSSNGIGVASVAPNARLCAVKVLDATGSGSFADLISGIVYAAHQRADVINMSLGAFVDASIPAVENLVDHLQAAISYAISKGSVVVAAAGNDGVNLATDPRQFLSIPAELAGVISVGATAPTGQQNFDQLASYTDFGSNGKSFGGGVTLFAPGGDYLPGSGGVFRDLIISACSEYAGLGCGPRDYLLGAGTSFSSPMAAGEGAVVSAMAEIAAEGEERERQGALTADCVRSGTDKIGPRSIFGLGRINVVKAGACPAEGGGGGER
jgi:subtilisin family serine protease